MTEKNMQQPAAEATKSVSEVKLPIPLAKDRKPGHFVEGERVIYFYFLCGRVFHKTGRIHGKPNGSVVMRADRFFVNDAPTEDSARNKEIEPTSHQLLKRKEVGSLKNQEIAAVWFEDLYPKDEIRKIVREFKSLGFGVPEPMSWKPPVKKTPPPPKIHHTVSRPSLAFVNQPRHESRR